MKIVVDELPIIPRYDCPFINLRYNFNECKLDDNQCECNDEGCRWLIPLHKTKMEKKECNDEEKA